MGSLTGGLNAGTYNVTFTQNEDASQIIGEPQQFTVLEDGDVIYFGYDAVENQTTINTTGAPVGDLTKQRAVWVNRDTLLWKISGGASLTYALVYSPEAALEINSEGIRNGSEVRLSWASEKPDVYTLSKYPHLRDYAVFRLTETDPQLLGQILKGRVAVIARNLDGRVVDATGVQIPGVLDDLYPYEGPLGADLRSGYPNPAPLGADSTGGQPPARRGYPR